MTIARQRFAAADRADAPGCSRGRFVLSRVAPENRTGVLYMRTCSPRPHPPGFNMTTRFTARAQLPQAEHILTPRDTSAICDYFVESAARGNVIGFDTETSGLDFDGLGVFTHYVCLADDQRRAMVRVSGDYARNMLPVATALQEIAPRCAGFNIIYDWNALEGYTKYRLGWANPLKLTTCYAEGMKLWGLFDEDAEKTYGARGLKARARQHLGLPMSSFDKLLDAGGILDAIHADPARAIDYATRDAWAHRKIVLLGQEITESMPWAGECPVCGEPMFVEHRSRGLWECTQHGVQRAKRILTMWDWHSRFDVPYMSVLQQMQTRGLPVNWERIEAYIPVLTHARDEAHREFAAKANESLLAVGAEPRAINPNASKQLEVWLYGDTDDRGQKIGVGLPVTRRTKTNNPSTNIKVLKVLRIKYPIVADALGALFEFRAREKILKTYLLGLKKRRFEFTGRVHGTFRAEAATGRLTSKDPNMQNIPASPLTVWLPAALKAPSREELERDGYTPAEIDAELARPVYKPEKVIVDIRRCIEAPEGYSVICADYSQLEVRLTAHESGCEALTRVIHEGLDLHCYTASIAFADALAGADYNLIYEAKQASDDDLGPFWNHLAKAVRDPLEGNRYVKVRTAKMTDVEAARAYHADWEAFLAGVRADVGTRNLDQVVELLKGTCTDRAHFDRVKALAKLRYKELVSFRKVAKPAIFGIIYGIGPQGLAVQITDATGIVTDRETAAKLIKSIREDAYPGVGRMMARLSNQVRMHGYVRTAMLRYRHPAGVRSGDGAKVAKAVRQAGNFPIQGLAADIVERAMIAIEADPNLRRLSFNMVNQVHDELVGLAPIDRAHEACAIMVHHMKTAHGLKTHVPIDVTGKVASNWGDAK